MYRLLLVAVLSCIAISGFARKKVYLEARFRFPMPPIEVFIDEEYKELTLDIGNELLGTKILVTDVTGCVICSEELNSEGVSILELPRIEKGKYLISIFVGDIEFYGFFEI